MTTKIPLVVVEQHQHALEHIHYVLRKNKKVLNSSWTMLHFDSHPDLACSYDLSAKLCFQPRRSEKSLYDHLDETSSGIAEWILPLVLAAKLENIVWVKRPLSRQFALGEANFLIGVLSKRPLASFLDMEDDAVVRVDYQHPYYLDDDVVVDTDRIQLAQSVNLHVKHVGDTIIPLGDPWMLDICLDYFICRNPFLRDLELVHSEYAALIASVSKDGIELATKKDDYLSERQTFHKAFENLVTNQDQGQALSRYLCNESDARVIQIHQILNKADNVKQLASMTMEALPHMAMPHETDIPSMSDIEERIEHVMLEIQRFSSTVPFLVTIARSTNDGFCPTSLVEQIWDKLLRRIHRHYCGASTCDDDDGSCILHVVKDYGVWEGSTLGN